MGERLCSSKHFFCAFPQITNPVSALKIIFADLRPCVPRGAVIFLLAARVFSPTCVESGFKCDRSFFFVTLVNLNFVLLGIAFCCGFTEPLQHYSSVCAIFILIRHKTQEPSTRLFHTRYIQSIRAIVSLSEKFSEKLISGLHSPRIEHPCAQPW